MGVRQQFNLHCTGSCISTDLGVRCVLPWTCHSATSTRNGKSMGCTPIYPFWILKLVRSWIRIISESSCGSQVVHLKLFWALCLHLLHIIFDEIPSCSICLELLYVSSLFSSLVSGIWELLTPKANCLSGFPENLSGVEPRGFLQI